MKTLKLFRHYVVYYNSHPNLYLDFEQDKMFDTYRDVARFISTLKHKVPGATVTRIIRLTMEDVSYD